MSNYALQVFKAGGDSGLVAIRDLHEASYRARFAVITRQVRANAPAVLHALNSANFEGAMHAVVDPFLPLADSAVSAFLEGGHATAKQTSVLLGKVVTFDITSPEAAAAVRRIRDLFAANWTANAISSMRNIVQEGMRNYASNADIAQQMVDCAGIPFRDEMAIRHYAATLASTAQQRLDDEGNPIHLPLTVNQMNRMVTANRNRTRRGSVARLAATEMQRAVHSGQDAALRQLRANGHIKDAGRLWVADPKSDRHSKMCNQRCLLDTPFKSNASNTILYPGDPAAPAEETINCRCTLTFEVVPV
jgi:hypothetical protein